MNWIAIVKLTRLFFSVVIAFITYQLVTKQTND